MKDSVRLQIRILTGIMLVLAVLTPLPGFSESEVYRRQVKFEIDRARDFRKHLDRQREIERELMRAVPNYKEKIVADEKRYEQTRAAYSVARQKEEARKPTDEFIERMLAQEAAKEENAKEKTRKEYRALKKEIERAIANTRLDEMEEYQLDRQSPQ